MVVQETRVVDQVSGWLRVFDDGSVDRTFFGPPEAKFMVEPVPPHENFVDGIATQDVDFGSGSRVRIYMPESDPDEKFPLIVHFPGGGFCVSDPDWFMYYAFYSKLARLGRAIVVSVYLLHAPENRLPAIIDHAFSALLWLTTLAPGGKAHDSWVSNKADFNRVFLIGDSSGSNIVHEVAARAGRHDPKPLKLSGIIPIHPGVCRAKRSRSELEMPQTPFLTLDMVDKFLSLALPKGSTKDHPITCPMGPTAPPLKDVDLPKMLLCVAEKDLFIDTNMEFYEALKDAKKQVELFVSPNMTHSFYLNRIAVDHDPYTKAQTENLFQAILQFINAD